MTARLDPDDVAENDAARELAEALAGAAAGSGNGSAAGAGLVTGAAFTGRCNLLAAVRGVLCVDEEGVAAVNAVVEELTLANLPHETVVDPRRLAATVKVIPFAVKRSHLDSCLRIVGERRGIVRVAEFRPRRAALVLTVLPGTRPSVLDKTASSFGTSSPASARTSRPNVDARTRRTRWRPRSPASSPRAAICWSCWARPRSWTAATSVPAAIELAGGAVHG